MKAYHIYFIALKVFVTIQFIMILLKKQSDETIYYLVSDSIFKISVGFFLIIYFWLHKLPELQWEDRLIIAFGGVLLIFEVVYNRLPIILKRIFDVDFQPAVVASDATVRVANVANVFKK